MNYAGIFRSVARNDSARLGLRSVAGLPTISNGPTYRSQLRMIALPEIPIVLRAGLLFCAGMVAIAGIARTDADSKSQTILSDDVLLAMRSAPAGEIVTRAAEAGIVLSPESFAYVLFDQVRTPFPLEGIAADEHVGLVLLRRDDGHVPVLIGKADEDSPARDFLMEAGYAVWDHGDWTFASPEPDVHEGSGERFDEWIRWIGNRREYEVEIEWNAGILSRRAREAANRLTGPLVEGFAAPDLDSDSFDADAERARADEGYREVRGTFLAVAGFVDLLMGELESLTEVRLEVSLNPDAVAIYASVVPERSSHLAAFLRADHTAAIDPAGWLDANGTGAYLLGIDPDALYAYLDTVVRSAEGVEAEAVAEYAEPFLDFLRTYAEVGRVAMAGGVAIPGLDSIEAFKMPVTDEDFRTIVRRYIALWDYEGIVEVVFDRDTVGGLPVHVIEENGAVSYYLVKAGDNVFSGEDRERVYEAARQFSDGRRPEASVADLFEERKRVAFQATLDRAAVLESLGPIVGTRVAARLAEAGQPRLEVESSGGQARAKLEIPVRLLQAFQREVDALREIVAEEKFAFEPEE